MKANNLDYLSIEFDGTEKSMCHEISWVMKLDSKALSKLWSNSTGRIKREGLEKAMIRKHRNVKVNQYNVY